MSARPGQPVSLGKLALDGLLTGFSPAAGPCTQKRMLPHPCERVCNALILPHLPISRKVRQPFRQHTAYLPVHQQAHKA